MKIVLEPFPEETITKILREKDVLDNSVIPKRLQKALVKRCVCMVCNGSSSVNSECDLRCLRT